MNQSEIEHQILDLLDGNLSSHEMALLEDVLRTDPEALEAYVRLVDLHNGLQTQLGVESPSNQTALVPVDRIIARQRRRVLRGSLFAPAAILVGMAVVMFVFLIPKQPEQIGRFKTTPDARYSLGFEGEGMAPQDGVLTPGSRLSLRKGAFECEFSNGVRIVAEGPCELLVHTENEVHVDEGVVWFRVPAAAAGFVAKTPEFLVEDLGTEFGVISFPDSPDEVHVIEGSVEVTMLTLPGEAQVLAENMARRVGPLEQLVEIEASSSRFRKEIDQPSVEISNFSFTGDPWVVSKESNFAEFARKAPSRDSDPNSKTSNLRNHGFTGGGYGSFYIRDADTKTSIFGGTSTPGVGMNLGRGNQDVPTHFVSFEVTPDSGFRTSFESLSFYLGVNGELDRVFVELRVWDGTKELTLGSVSHISRNLMNGPVLLKTIDFGNFSSSRALEFRLYAYGVSEPQEAPASGGIRIDDLVLHGKSEKVEP